MNLETELQPDEKELVAAVISESDDVLLEVLGQIEVQERPSFGATPPSAKELKRLGEERLDKWRQTFCREIRSHKAVEFVLTNDEHIEFVERVYAVVVAARGANPVELVVCGVLAARQGFVVFCKDVNCEEAIKNSSST